MYLSACLSHSSSFPHVHSSIPPHRTALQACPTTAKLFNVVDQKYPQYCWEYHGSERPSQEPLLKKKRRPRGVPSRTGQRAPNPHEFAQPRLSRVKRRSSPARGYKFGCVCSYMAGHYPGILMTGHIGTNTPKFVPPRWGRPPFDPTQNGLCKFGWVWSSLNWGGENSRNALEPSNALNHRAWGILAVLSRGNPGEALRAFPVSFRNFLRKVPAVLWVWPS